jgi:hypothetical protein
MDSLTPAVPARIAQLAAALSQAEPIRRGSLYERWMKCGQAACACQSARKTSGPAHADTVGTHLTREESALRACTSGAKRSASRAVGGRRIRIGMRKERNLVVLKFRKIAVLGK